MDITFREIREFGESLIILDQHPSQISTPALGNTYCTICLNLKHRKDINAMGQCMLLDDKERDLLGMLEVGQGVVKLQGRISKPFMVSIPEFRLQKGEVSDEMIRKRMAAVVRLSSRLRGAEFAFSGPLTSDLRLVKGTESDTLKIDFLRDIEDRPDSGIAERYKRLGISVRQGQKLKDRLAREGLIEEFEERISTGRIRRMRLTRKAGESCFKK